MTDHSDLIAAWRKAMEGVTPGEWLWRGKDGGLYQEGQDPYAYGDAVLVPVYEHDSGVDTVISEPDAAWLARCSPSGISKLLDALSSQSLSLSEARALAEAQQNGNRFASSQWTKCELRLKEAEEDRARLLKQRQERAAERDALVAAGEELVIALGRNGFPMSDEAWRNTGDDAPVNSQASVEARALHRAAAAYLRAISGGFDGGK